MQFCPAIYNFSPHGKVKLSDDFIVSGKLLGHQGTFRILLFEYCVFGCTTFFFFVILFVTYVMRKVCIFRQEDCDVSFLSESAFMNK